MYPVQAKQGAPTRAFAIAHRKDLAPAKCALASPGNRHFPDKRSMLRWRDVLFGIFPDRFRGQFHQGTWPCKLTMEHSRFKLINSRLNAPVQHAGLLAYIPHKITLKKKESRTGTPGGIRTLHGPDQYLVSVVVEVRVRFSCITGFVASVVVVVFRTTTFSATIRSPSRVK